VAAGARLLRRHRGDCYFACIERVPSGVATLRNQTQPIYTLAFSWPLIAERARRASRSWRCR